MSDPLLYSRLLRQRAPAACASEVRNGGGDVVDRGAPAVQGDTRRRLIRDHQTLGKASPEGMDVLEIKMPIGHLRLRKVEHADETAGRKIKDHVIGDQVSVNECSILGRHRNVRIYLDN